MNAPSAGIIPPAAFHLPENYYPGAGDCQCRRVSAGGRPEGGRLDSGV